MNNECFKAFLFSLDDFPPALLRILFAAEKCVLLDVIRRTEAECEPNQYDRAAWSFSKKQMMIFVCSHSHLRPASLRALPVWIFLEKSDEWTGTPPPVKGPKLDPPH